MAIRPSGVPYRPNGPIGESTSARETVARPVPCFPPLATISAHEHYPKRIRVHYNLGTDEDSASSSLTASATTEDVQAAVLEQLRRAPRHAELVARLLSAMRRRNIPPAEVEQALAELQSRPEILVREHYCADPHLAKADLRVAALIEPSESHQDPVTQACDHIDAVWQRWLNDYLSNHTCV
jgi:hypothetical protein